MVQFGAGFPLALQEFLILSIALVLGAMTGTAVSAQAPIVVAAGEPLQLGPRRRVVTPSLPPSRFPAAAEEKTPAAATPISPSDRTPRIDREDDAGIRSADKAETPTSPAETGSDASVEEKPATQNLQPARSVPVAPEPRSVEPADPAPETASAPAPDPRSARETQSTPSMTSADPPQADIPRKDRTAAESSGAADRTHPVAHPGPCVSWRAACAVSVNFFKMQALPVGWGRDTRGTSFDPKEGLHFRPGFFETRKLLSIPVKMLGYSLAPGSDDQPQNHAWVRFRDPVRDNFHIRVFYRVNEAADSLRLKIMPAGGSPEPGLHLDVGLGDDATVRVSRRKNGHVVAISRQSGVSNDDDGYLHVLDWVRRDDRVISVAIDGRPVLQFEDMPLDESLSVLAFERRGRADYSVAKIEVSTVSGLAYLTDARTPSE